MTKIQNDVSLKVYTCVVGTNADLIANAARLYLHPGDHVLDATYGKGRFWKKYDRTQIRLVTNDLITPADVKCDFRHLPFADGTFDHSFLDPAYMHDGATVMIRGTYNNNVTTGKMNHIGIIRMYEAGMNECARVTKSDGCIWVKGQDEIASGQQCWSQLQLMLIACKMGLTLHDSFVLCNGAPHIQSYPQRHARRNHSFLLIFRKTSRRNKADQFTETLILEVAAAIQRRTSENTDLAGTMVADPVV